MKALLCLLFGTILVFSSVQVLAWATFEICETVSTVARGASVLITSPGYLGTSKPASSGAQMCECIIQSQNKADMYLEYLQTQLVSEGKNCPYEYIMIESKKNITQPDNDDQLEVCGQRHVKGRWFAGTLRLTYASGGPMEKRGLLAKFTVDNLGVSPRIQIECGKVNANGLKLQVRPQPNENGNTQSNSGSIPASGGFGPMGRPPWAMNFGNSETFGMRMPIFPQFPPLRPTFPVVPSLAPSGRPPPAPRADKLPPDFSNWNIKLEAEKNKNDNKGLINFANAVFKTTTPPKRKQTKAKSPDRASRNQPTQKRTPNKKSGAGKVMGEGIDATAMDENSVEKKSGSGGMVALVFGGIGSVLIIGSVGILTLHNYRKRQRIKRKEAEYASGGSASMTYGKGWDSASVESVYATVADINLQSGGCVNPAVVNDEFGTGNDPKSDGIEKEDPSDIFGKCSDFGTYDRISLKTPKASPKLVREVAVIEVHQSHNGKQDKLDYLKDEGCQYAHSGRFNETNRCTDCNIERPPRRKDKDNNYDNNVGVKRLRN